MAGPDVLDADFVSGELQDGLGQGLDGRGRGLLHEKVALLAVLEGVDDEIDRVLEGHHEARHLGVGDGDVLAGGDLVEEEGDDAAAARHDVAITCEAEGRVARQKLAGPRDDVLLHQGLGDAHGVDRICGFVGRKEDGVPDAVGHAGGDHVVRADDVGLHGLERVELAGRDLFEGRGAEDVVDALEGVGDAVVIPHVTNIEL